MEQKEYNLTRLASTDVRNSLPKRSV